MTSTGKGLPAERNVEEIANLERTESRTGQLMQATNLDELLEQMRRNLSDK